MGHSSCEWRRGSGWHDRRRRDHWHSHGGNSLWTIATTATTLDGYRQTEGRQNESGKRQAPHNASGKAATISPIPSLPW